jgi:hypothetical protein
MLQIFAVVECFSQHNIVGDSIAIQQQLADSIVENRKADSLSHIQDSINLAKERAMMDSIAIDKQADSLVKIDILTALEKNFIANPIGEKINAIETLRVKHNKSFEFFSLIIVLLLPAIFKYLNGAYFKNMFVAYRYPNISARQLKEQLSQNSLASLFMDFYFCLVFALFAHVLIKHYVSTWPMSILANDWMLWIVLTIAFGVIYFVKYLFINFLGWVLKAKEVMSVYIFNVFLLNKILSFILLPFIALMSLSSLGYFQSFTLVSIIVVLFFFVQRYIRSISTFNYLYSYSRFHFFLYLCASELVPVFLIGKLILKYFISS